MLGRRNGRLAGLAGAAGVAVLLLLPGALRAQEIYDLGSVVWRMRGTLVADRKTANGMGWTGVTIGFTGAAAGSSRWFGAVHAELFGGDTFDAWNYVNNVSHYNPTFTVVGPPTLASQLQSLPNGTRVALEGVLDPRARTLLLDVVQPLQPSGGS